MLPDKRKGAAEGELSLADIDDANQTQNEEQKTMQNLESKRAAYRIDLRSYVDRRQELDRREAVRFEDDRRQYIRRAEDRRWRLS